MITIYIYHIYLPNTSKYMSKWNLLSIMHNSKGVEMSWVSIFNLASYGWYLQHGGCTHLGVLIFHLPGIPAAFWILHLHSFATSPPWLRCMAQQIYLKMLSRKEQFCLGVGQIGTFWVKSKTFQLGANDPESWMTPSKQNLNDQLEILLTWAPFQSLLQRVLCSFFHCFSAVSKVLGFRPNKLICPSFWKAISRQNFDPASKKIGALAKHVFRSSI